MILLMLTAALAADPLLTDSFETGSAAPDGWRQGPAVPGVTYRYDKRAASDGERSLALKKTANRYFPIAGWVRSVDAGGVLKVRVAAQVKAEKATKAVIDVNFLDAAGKVTGHEWAAYIGAENAGDPPATHDWKEYAGTLDVPAGTAKLGIVLQIYGPGEVWFDELSVTPAGEETASAAPPAPKAEPITVSIGEAATRYILHGAADGPPRPLVLVLPGGDGSADFAPFVGTIQSAALKGEAVVAQMIAPGHVVWPTDGSRSRTPSTEEAMAAVINDAAGRTPIDRDAVFAVAWSSGGPAVYAAILAEDSPLAGALVAMSVFKPDQLPPLSRAAGKRVFILHSPEDRVCPIRMARDAETQLRDAGATVKFQEYAGGHGWHGDIHGTIGGAFEWLLGR